MEGRIEGKAAVTTARQDAGIVARVCVAHAFSHFYHLLLTPLLPLLKDEFDLSYAALGAVMTVIYVVSGLLQTPAGMAVDRFGARTVLAAGLLAMAGGVSLFAIAPSYPWLFVAAIVTGAGNSTFHPGDMALLNAKVAPERLGYAFSAHGIAGNVGWVIAPLFAAALAEPFGWRASLGAGALLGLAYAVYFATHPSLVTERAEHGTNECGSAASQERTLHQLFAPAVVMCFLFFLLTAIGISGFTTFGIAALTELFQMPLAFASAVLTSFLVGGVLGTMAGGVIAARTARHGSVAATGVAAAALLTMAIGFAGVPSSSLPALAGMVGLALGVTNPSRDILVRAAAPAHARGKVYGFVYSGLDTGAGIAPLVLGAILDTGQPAWVFGAAAICLLLAMPTTLALKSRPSR